MIGLPPPPRLPALASEWYDTHPAAGLEYWLSQLGGSQPFLNYLRRQLPTFQNQWYAALPLNPDLHFVDFLNPDLLRQSFAAASPFERFERPNAFAPSYRYIPF